MQKPFQLEFFRAKQYQSDGSKHKKQRQNFFGFIKLHEKAVSIIIIAFIISLISFSLGVEKGKKLTKQAQSKTELEVEQIISPEPLLEEKLEIKQDISRYTVQVASFKTKLYAQKEAKRLEKKGLRALVMPKGNYVIVCVGDFTEKKQARIAQNQLKDKYHDCFIREL